MYTLYYTNLRFRLFYRLTAKSRQVPQPEFPYHKGKISLGSVLTLKHFIIQYIVRKFYYSHSIYNGQTSFINRFRKIYTSVSCLFRWSSKDSPSDGIDVENIKQRLGGNTAIEWLQCPVQSDSDISEINGSHPSFVSGEVYFLSGVALQEGIARIFIKRMRYIWIVMTERAGINGHFPVTGVNSK